MKQLWRTFASGTTFAAFRSLARSLKVRRAPTVTSTCWWSSSRVGCRVCWHWPAWNWSFPSYWAGDESICGRRKTFHAIFATRRCVLQRYSILAKDRVHPHAYCEINIAIVWPTVTQEIPALLPQLRALATDE